MERSASDTCLLCCCNVADKKGSHIIPAFLISTAISYNGSTKRDYELMTMFRAGGFIETFVGRKVLPHAIDSVTNKFTQYDTVSDNINPNTRDHFFCSDCEKKLAMIEGWFSQEIYQSFESGKINLITSLSGFHYSSFTNPVALLIRLFFYTVFWRISSANYMVFKLPIKTQEKLRRLINNCLHLEEGKLIQNVDAFKNQLTDFKILPLYTEMGKDLTKGIIFADESKIPHFISINKFLLFFYENNRQSHIFNNTFYGLSDMFSVSDFGLENSSVLHVGYLHENQTAIFRQSILQRIVDEEREQVKKEFTFAFKHLFGFVPQDDVIYKYTHMLINSQVPAFDKLSRENVYKTMFAFFLEIDAFGRQTGQFPRYTIGKTLPWEFRLKDLKSNF